MRTKIDIHGVKYKPEQTKLIIYSSSNLHAWQQECEQILRVLAFQSTQRYF